MYVLKAKTGINSSIYFKCRNLHSKMIFDVPENKTFISCTKKLAILQQKE